MPTARPPRRYQYQVPRPPCTMYWTYNHQMVATRNDVRANLADQRLRRAPSQKRPTTMSAHLLRYNPSQAWLRHASMLVAKMIRALNATKTIKHARAQAAMP